MAQEQLKIGYMAASIRNESAGWNVLEPLPIRLIDFFAQRLAGIKIDGLYLQRPILYRPLPKGMGEEVFSHSLAVAGILSIEFANIENSDSRRKIPYIVDDARSLFNFPFILNIPERNESDNPDSGCWSLIAELNTKYLWRVIPLSLSAEAERTSYE